MSRRYQVFLAVGPALALGWLVSPLLCAPRPAVQGLGPAQLAHADAVSTWALTQSPTAVNSPGGAFFDAEWAMGTCQMTVLGLGQVVLERPALRERHLPAIARCADWLATPEARVFGTQRWGRDGVDDVPGRHAYLGYLNLALSMQRLLDPSSAHAALNDRLTAQLARSLEMPVARFATYPGEVYPVDQSAAAASVALHARASGQDRTALLRGWLQRWQRAGVDPASGMLWQRLGSQDGEPQDAPRGSGTALAVYFLSFVDATAAARLYRGMQLEQPFGLGGFREYPRGVRGAGDIDSGPVVLGLGVSASGFGLAGARLTQDAVAFDAILRSAQLVGRPQLGARGLWYWSGGAIGNAILLAMTTLRVEAHTIDPGASAPRDPRPRGGPAARSANPRASGWASASSALLSSAQQE